jgi:DNA-binding CsgD family transcriptional regulator
MKKSATQQALELVAQGLTPYAAAQQCGIKPPTVYAAIKRGEGKPRCPCCGQVVREGFAVDVRKLKTGK